MISPFSDCKKCKFREWQFSLFFVILSEKIATVWRDFMWNCSNHRNHVWMEVNSLELKWIMILCNAKNCFLIKIYLFQAFFWRIRLIPWKEPGSTVENAMPIFQVKKQLISVVVRELPSEWWIRTLDMPLDSRKAKTIILTR